VSTTASLVFAVLVLSGGPGPAPQSPLVPEPAYVAGQFVDELLATQNFQRHIADYVVLRESLERELPPTVITPDVGQIDRTARALRVRIQIARATAHQGDIITPEVARMFRRRIAICLTDEEWKACLAERARDEQGEPVQSPPLHVNMEWPAGVPYDYVPPQLLQSLPALPEDLQYRIIGQSLVLWDCHANLIVDFLPGAFAPTT
jgi:hypothetical protein